MTGPDLREAQVTVSVVMPFLDSAPFLAEAVESVLAQSYGGWELLLVDDGSSDGSHEIAAGYAERQGHRVRVLAHPGHENRGASAARNLGIREARGRYVAFLDADDAWLPAKLEEQVALMDATPRAGMLYGRTEYWYSWTGRPEDRGRDHVPALGVRGGTLVEPPDLLARMLRYRVAAPCTCSVMVRRDVAVRVGGFEESFRRVYTDQAFYAKVMLESPVLVADGCWDRYRQHPGSSSAERRSGRPEEARVAFLEWVGGYLAARGSADRRLRAALESAMWPHRHPLLYRLLRPGFRLASRGRRLLLAAAESRRK